MYYVYFVFNFLFALYDMGMLICTDSVWEAPPKNLHPLFGHCPNAGGVGGEGLSACPDCMGHPYIWVKMREKVHQGARWSLRGGVCDRYLGNARIEGASFSVGLPKQSQYK